MKRMILPLLGTALWGGLWGCQTRESAMSAMIEYGDCVYLTTLGPAVETPKPEVTQALRLGAGDALGRAVFVRYVAYVQALQADEGSRWATAEEESPRQD